jgi:hypothetical protein
MTHHQHARQPITCTDFQSQITLITGRPTPTPLCANQPITRLEAARLIATALPPINLGIAGGLIPRFPDIQQLTYDQKDAIRIVYAAGIMFGNQQNLFEPYSLLQTTEATEILARMRARLQAQRPSLPYEIIPLNSAPPQVAQVATATKSRPGGYVVQEPDATYVIISAGEYPTGGYVLEVLGVRQIAGQIEIDIELQTPSPDMMVIQVLTYPQLIVKLTKTDFPIKLV